MKKSRWICQCAGLAAVWFAVSSLLPAQAGERRDHDHDRARAALQAGEVMPLQKVLETLQRSHPGEVLEVELEHENGRWVYEFKLLQSGGRLVRLDVDARTAAVLRTRLRKIPAGRSPSASEPGSPS